jgi:hypothetical protein
MSRVRFSTVAALAALCGCGNQPASLSGLESFQVTLTSPTPDMLGTPAAPVTITDLTFDVRALDTQGQVYVQDLDADVFISFAGNKIGQLTNCGDNEDAIPLTTIHLTGGVAMGNQLKLIKTYGAATLWLQEHPTATSGQAVGASPTMYFPNPTIPEVQFPLDMTATTATWCTPFNNKHVVFDHATGNGKLVVTSVFIDSFVVGDTGANFNTMDGSGGFNHMYIYSFGKPPIEIVPGRILTQSDPLHPALSGNLSKFYGFSELNFPLQNTVDTVDPSLMPPVYQLQRIDNNNSLKMIRLEAATVALTGSLCTIDPTSSYWIKYNQINYDIGDGDCTFGFAVELAGKTMGDFDPLKLKAGIGAQRVTTIGMLRNNSGQSPNTPPQVCSVDADCTNATYPVCLVGECRKTGVFGFWTVVPRDPTDITLCGFAGQACCPVIANAPRGACDPNLTCSMTDNLCH